MAMTTAPEDSNKLHQHLSAEGDATTKAEAEKQRRPAWNTPSISNVPEVMGAISWPALSESTKLTSKASSSNTADSNTKAQAPVPNKQERNRTSNFVANRALPPEVGTHNNIPSSSSPSISPSPTPPPLVPYSVPRGGVYNHRPMIPFQDPPYRSSPTDPKAVNDDKKFPRKTLGHRPQNNFGPPNGNVHPRPFNRAPMINTPPFLPPPFHPMDYYYVPPFPMETYVSPPATPVMPLPDPSLLLMIRNQVEYYFSDENLVQDIFLRSQMDSEGWVHIDLIAGFNRVKFMTNVLQVVIDSLRASTQLEIRDDSKVRRRSNWMKWVAHKANTQNGA